MIREQCQWWSQWMQLWLRWMPGWAWWMWQLKIGDREAMDECGKCHERDDCRVLTSKKPWAQHNKRQRNHEKSLHDEAHTIDNCWASTDEDSHNGNEKTIASDKANTILLQSQWPHLQKKQKCIATLSPKRCGQLSSPMRTTMGSKTMTMRPFSPRRQSSSTMGIPWTSNDGPRQQKIELIKN